MTVKESTDTTPSGAAPNAAGRERGTLSLNAAIPSFTVNDVEKSLAWYRDVLGFKVKERWETDGKLEGVEMKAGEVSFMLGQDDWKKGRDRVKGEGIRMFCSTDQDVDSVAGQVKAAGGTLSQEPNDDWGMRSFSVIDPNGFKITIAKTSKS
ncbi:MAG TPA: VOC family protein [Thermoanaerobaculia bacterium]|nr:VOC family protein [Thermoanaerobaculia bacterium]